MGLAVRGLDLPIWLAKQAADTEGIPEVGQTESDGSHSRSCTATQRSWGSAGVAVAARAYSSLLARDSTEGTLTVLKSNVYDDQ